MGVFSPEGRPVQSTLSGGLMPNNSYLTLRPRTSSEYLRGCDSTPPITRTHKDKVQAWLLSMKATDELFAAKKLPKGCKDFYGHSFDSLFSKSLERFAFYNDSANLAKIKTHLDSLKAAIDARPPAPKKLQMLHSPAPVVEEPAADVQVAALRQELRAKDDELSTQDGELLTKDALVAKLRRRT